MDVSISEGNLARIRRKVESGRYSSTDEVLGSALALLDERDGVLEGELADVRDSVRRGTEQANAGRVVHSGEVFEGLRRRNAELVNRTR